MFTAVDSIPIDGFEIRATVKYVTAYFLNLLRNSDRRTACPIIEGIILNGLDVFADPELCDELEGKIREAMNAKGTAE